MARGATDGFVTDFGPILSLFFRDPDGLECEVCVENPDAEPGVFHPPGHAGGALLVDLVEELDHVPVRVRDLDRDVVGLVAPLDLAARRRRAGARGSPPRPHGRGSEQPKWTRLDDVGRDRARRGSAPS